jgi:hypothetical protein
MEHILHLVIAQKLNVQGKAINHVGHWLLTRELSCTLFCQSLRLIFVMLVLTIEQINVYFASSLETNLKKRHLILFQPPQLLLCEIEPSGLLNLHIILSDSHNYSLKVDLLPEDLCGHYHQALDHILQSEASQHLDVVRVPRQQDALDPLLQIGDIVVPHIRLTGQLLDGLDVMQGVGTKHPKNLVNVLPLQFDCLLLLLLCEIVGLFIDLGRQIFPHVHHI